MKLQKTKLGFTLIELLVVITIIGILATGAVGVYTTQIQKARDSTRISSLDALRVAVESSYQDNSEYPYATLFASTINDHLKKLPKDPKHGKTCNNGGSGISICAFAYKAGQDSNGIDYGAFEVSTAFEAENNVTKSATKDGGSDTKRLEVGNDLIIDTAIGTAPTGTKNGACRVDGTDKAVSDTDLIIINGSPTTLSNECD